MTKSVARNRTTTGSTAKSTRPRQQAPSVSAGNAARGASVIETAVVIGELDRLISGRARDLDILKDIAESVKAGASRGDIHRKLLMLARSSRDAFEALQSSRETLVSMHDTSTGGVAVTVVDETTGLPNRQAFDARLDEAFERGAATFDTVLMLIEIGALQLVASEIGGRIATRVLTRFSSILARNVKHTDFVARIGAQQFAIILRNVLPDHAGSIALRIHEAMQKKLLPGTDPVMQMLQVTIGITANKAEDATSRDLMARAQEALAMARKQTGGGIYIA